MAPLPEDSTARIFLTYSVAGQEHTLMARYDAAATPTPDALMEVSNFLEAMDAMVYLSSFVKAEVAAVGSNVRVPVAWPGITEWGASAGDPDSAPFFWSFTGKDITGRRFRVELFGRGHSDAQSWRLYAVDDTSIAAAVAVLETEEAVFLSIAGNTPIYNQYANRSVSQHWVGEIR